MSTETELKLEVAPRYAARVLAHPALEGRTSRANLLSVYYDTPKLDLWRARISVRLRRTPAGWLQTAKWAGSAVGGLHERNEIEQPVPAQTLTLDTLLGHAGLEALGDGRLRRRLKPLFVTEIDRTIRMLRLSDGASIEASLDRGRIVCGTSVRPLCELELELKGGSPLALFDIAGVLMQDLPLRPAHRSKAERGYLLAGLEDPPVKAKRVDLDPTWDLGRVAASVIASGLAQVQANEDGMLGAVDIEYLHQLRVGVRRLRSSMSALSPALPAGTLAPLKSELKWLGVRLGTARDWDVFRDESLPLLTRGLADVCEPAVLDELALAAAARGAGAGHGARAAWRSRRTSRLLLDLGCVTAGGGFIAVNEAMRQPAPPYCAALLTRRLERVVRLGKKAGGRASISNLHALRIAVKKLRYAVEFFGALYSADRVSRYRARLVKLQDSLGRLCDAAGMPERVREALPSNATLVDVVRGWSACVVHEERQRFAGLWRQFRRGRRFW